MAPTRNHRFLYKRESEGNFTQKSKGQAVDRREQSEREDGFEDGGKGP